MRALEPCMIYVLVHSMNTTRSSSQLSICRNLRSPINYKVATINLLHKVRISILLINT